MNLTDDARIKAIGREVVCSARVLLGKTAGEGPDLKVVQVEGKRWRTSRLFMLPPRLETPNPRSTELPYSTGR